MSNAPDVYSPNFAGGPSWIYYLFGAIFALFALISAYFVFRFRHSKQEHHPFVNTYSWFKRAWYMHRFVFFILLTIVLGTTAVIFFTLNSKLKRNLNQSISDSFNYLKGHYYNLFWKPTFLTLIR